MTNSSSDWDVVEKYNYLMSLRDPRVTGYFLMSSPFPNMAICAIYVYFVKSLGPRLMKDREPFDLKKTIVIYNIIQIAISIYIVYKGLIHAWLWRYSLRCQPIDFSDSPDELQIVFLCYLYYFCKVTELLDTVFFVLRKKFDQITHLHVIHHTLMALSVWWGASYFASGHGTFFGLINTFVHIIMYAYYLLSAMGPKYQKYLWWKKHLTLIQMIQFIIVFIHTAQLLFIECDYPRFNVYIMSSYSIMFFFLFSNFYIQAYIKRRRLPAALKKAEAEAKPLESKSIGKNASLKTAEMLHNEENANRTKANRFIDGYDRISNIVNLASKVCIIDQNGLYAPDKVKLSDEKKKQS